MPNPDNQRLSRRRFMQDTAKLAGAAAASSALMGNYAFGQDSAAKPVEPSLVIRVTNENLIINGVVHQRILRETVDEALKAFFAKGTAAEAWHEILSPDDVIGLKFNQSGAKVLATNEPVALTLIQSLREAGWPPDQIVPIEAPMHVYESTGVQRPNRNWTKEELDFGSGQDRLAGWLEQVTAIINVPFFKTHNIAGMTGCLKNLSHASVKHPARFHAHGCSPFIPDIFALPQIRGKVRLHLVNALRTAYQGGPEPGGDHVTDYASLVIGTDPVAVDRIGLEVLNEQRAVHELPAIDLSEATVPYLLAAAKSNLGKISLYDINLTSIKV